MKTYCVFLLITSLLLSQWSKAPVSSSAQAVELSSSVKHSLLTAYKPPRVGIPGRREGAGTR